MALDGDTVTLTEHDALGQILLVGGISTGRCAASRERSATRAERLEDLVELKVATASTSVPPAVASEEIVTQSAMT